MYLLSVVTNLCPIFLSPGLWGFFCILFHIGMILTVMYGDMEILAYTSILFALGVLFSALLLSSNPYYKNKINKAVNGLNIAYEVALQKAEELEILKHKWLESEKVGHDIGIESAQKSWKSNHAEEWRKSKRKAA